MVMLMINIKITGFGIELTSLTIDDIEMVRMWRNHIDVNRYMLNQSFITAQQQINWFNKVKGKTDQLHLLISYKGEAIGVINAKSFDEQCLNKAKVISPGLYLSPEGKYRNSILAFSPSLVFIEYLFQLENTQTLLAQVLPDNTSAIRYNETLGYTKKSVDEQGVVTMQLLFEDFNIAKAKLAKTLRF